MLCSMESLHYHLILLEESMFQLTIFEGRLTKLPGLGAEF